MKSSKRLVRALWSDLPRSKFATGGKINEAVYPMPASIRVEGAGDLALPLSRENFLKLKAVSTQAPFGRGEQTLLDTDVRRAWQVEASNVSCPQISNFFSKVALDLAVPAMTELGIDADALGLEMRLYKLLAYEEGGHFKVHRDTEKEVGMFATMILQLPTQAGHEGGQLEVRHGKKRAVFDFSGDKSMTGYFKTIFFCDCEHKLAEVTSGIRLCLAFSLLRNNAKFMDVDVSRYISALGRVQKLLKEWANTAEGTRLAIPLGHKYSENSLSFAGLKGHDRVVATLVLSCTNFLDVHLCMLVKTVITDENRNRPETEYEIENSTRPDDRKMEQSWWLDEENVLGSPFDETDEEWHEPYNGNDGGCLHSLYHAAALLVWPKESNIKELCRKKCMFDTLNWLQEQHQHEPERTSRDLHAFLKAVFEGKTEEQSTCFYETLLEFCIRHGFRDDAFTVMKKRPLALTNPKVMLSGIQKYGWDACYQEMTQLLHFSEQTKLLRDILVVWDESDLQETAVSVAKHVLNGEELSKHRKHLVANLVKFFAGLELEEETWLSLSVLSQFDVPCLTQAVKSWGEEGISRVHEFLKRWLSEEEQSWKANANNTSDHAAKAKELEGKKGFLRNVAMFALALNDAGCHGAAVAFAKEDFLKDVNLEELYNGNKAVSVMDAIALLLRCDARLHGAVRLVERQSRPELIRRMREEAKLIGLKKDDKVTDLFAELLSELLHLPQGENASALDVEAVDTVFWLGNEKLVSDVVKRAESDPSALENLFESSKKKYSGKIISRADYRRCKEDGKENILKRAEEWDAVGKSGFVEVVKARIRASTFKEDEVMKDTEDGRTDGEEDENEEDESDFKTRKTPSKELDHLRIKRAQQEEEVQWLCGILAGLGFENVGVSLVPELCCGSSLFLDPEEPRRLEFKY